mgnify:FL=1
METILKVVCMYCGAGMGEKDGQGVEGISHGICEQCWYDRYPGCGLDPGRKILFKEAVKQVIETRKHWESYLIELGHYQSYRYHDNSH